MGSRHLPAGGGVVKATPLMVNGVLYFSTPDHAYAVEARTGRTVREQVREPCPSFPCVTWTIDVPTTEAPVLPPRPGAAAAALHDAMARFVAVWREMGTAGIARPPLPDELRDELVEVGILSAREV